ncbi:L,D-transpeptidase family protein [Lentzea nigeriaca]|uniref:L,D-transpeptidase family protein n=1 Tax=Lentzea nigeriaca TaxID=1128665 RepID=UPI00195ECCE1|nr:L,D-transpeptidase family protein [Lentzea nigeriaca]MBM7861014.1 L,D-peptidoglycan transpeptidase YkuD (ErfK/YbiS/YcfS/YnhG family) [Lentzea nigeriaca]
MCPAVAVVAVAALVVVSATESPQVSPVAESGVQRTTSAELTTVSSVAESSSSAVPTTTTVSSAAKSTSSSAPKPAAVVAPVPTARSAEPPWFASRVAGATQVISVVGAGGSNATLSTWQKSGSDWTQVVGATAAKVGSPGISSSYGESSSATPAGVFAITGAFGRQADPGTGVSYFQLDSSDWWVSDVNSPDYNTHQRCARGTCPFNESTSENLLEHGAVYDYALVMGVNSQRVPGAGSAFFVHVTNGAATAGCVAIPASTLVSIMRWVRPGTVIALSPR